MSRSLGGTLLTTRGADADFAAGDVLQPRDHAQQGGLAAAGRADQDHELAVLDIDGNPMDDLRRPISLLHVSNFN